MKITATTLNESIIKALDRSVDIIPDDTINSDDLTEFEMKMHNEAIVHKIIDSFDADKIKDFKVLLNTIEQIDLNEYYKYLKTKTKKEQQLDSYINHSKLESSKLIAELGEKRNKYVLELTLTTFGTELLENFAYEVFLRLFDKRSNLYPINLEGNHLNDEDVDFSSSRESIAESYLNYIVYDAKLYLMSQQKTDDADKANQLIDRNEQSPERIQKGKPGRKKVEVLTDFSLKDVASANQINALNKLLLKNGYIEEVNGIYIYTQSTAKPIEKFATIIKYLGDYGYSTKITAKQAYYILINDYNVNAAESTVSQAKEKSALSLLKNNRFPENYLK